MTESEARAALAAWAIDSIGDTAVETGISAISDGARLAARNGTRNGSDW